MPGDILDVIVGALLAGAGKVLKDTTAGAMKTAYARFIEGLRDRFGKAKVDELEKIAQDTGDEETVRTHLAEMLADASIAADDEVVVAAREVCTNTDSAGSKYHIVAQDSPIGVVGDYGTATLNFGPTELGK